MTRRLLSCVPALILALARFVCAQTYEVIHRSPGGYTIAPSGLLLAMADGTFYGTTPTGGEFGQGSIFRLTSNGSGLVWTDVQIGFAYAVLMLSCGASPSAASPNSSAW